MIEEAVNQRSATSAASSLSIVYSLFISISSSVVIEFEISCRISFASSSNASSQTSGMMLFIPKTLSGSSSATKSFSVNCGLLDCMRTTSTSSCFKALTLMGPETSPKTLNSLNLSPYCSSKPLRPSARGSHSGGPPAIISEAGSTRSSSVSSSNSLATSLLTAIALLSKASEESRTLSWLGRASFKAASTVSVVLDVCSGSKYDNSAPLYSGTTLISQDSTC